MRAGVIGIGDVGSGLAKNLINNGFSVRGRDLTPERMTSFTAMGGLAPACWRTSLAQPCTGMVRVRADRVRMDA